MEEEKKIGAPRKKDGSKKIPITISVREDRLKKLGKELLKRYALAGVESGYKNHKEVASNQSKIE